MTKLRLFLAASLFTFAANAQEIRYPVATAHGTPKFEAIYREVAVQEAESRSDKPIRFTITQNIEGTLYLARRGDETFAVQMQAKKYVDNTVVSVPLANSEETYEYTTILGAKATVLKLIETTPKPISIETFTKTLKTGGTYYLTKGSYKVKCSSCGGFGGSSLEKTKCRNCGGRGHFVKPQKYLVVWE